MMTIAQTVTRTAAAFLIMASLTAVPALAQDAADGKNGLETRISTLHEQLQITPDQEKKWQAVAKTMRRGAEESRSLVMEKRKDEATLTAVADLNAYAEIADAHAKHARHLAKVFATLYDSMSDDQKKIADEVFRKHKRDSSADQPPAPAPTAQ
jgi:hypothetical protein